MMHEIAKSIDLTCDVAIVGGGTAGLSLSRELMKLGAGKVVILEREEAAGGIPRHCGHYPFGVREYARLMKGPDYARRNVEEASKAGVDIRTGVTVTKLLPDGNLSLTSAQGLSSLKAKRVVLCTGVRESSRAQRFITGDRTCGVLSTAALQSLVYLKGIKPFRNPVILGSELVSFSAINTCRHLGIKPVAMVEEQERIIAQAPLAGYLPLNGIKLVTGARNPQIVGGKRVRALRYETSRGDLREINCDGVIISGHFRPESALLRDSHIEIDHASGGPAIDQFGRCSDPSFFAAGNLLRPVETSGFCWREAVAIANWIVADLDGEIGTNANMRRFRIKDPSIRFVVPQRLAAVQAGLGMESMQIAVTKPVRSRLVARSDNQEIWSASIRTRPVRRLLLPLKALYQNSSADDIELSLD